MANPNFTIECMRCGEADDRAIGTNKCGLCELEFFVSCNGAAYAPAKRIKPRATEPLANDVP